MARALRIIELPQAVPLPEELLAESEFKPERMLPDVVEELRRRSELARRHLAEAMRWKARIDELSDDIAGNVNPDNFLTAELSAAQFVSMEREAEGKFGQLIETHETWRTLSELRKPADRTAWLGFIDPYLEILRLQIETPRAARRKIFSAIRATLPGIYKDDFDERDPESLLDRRAAEFLRVAMERRSGLRCEVGWDRIGGEAMPVVTVKVPSQIERPHRVFAEAEQQALDDVERTLPELSGRVAVTYERLADAA